MSLSQPIAQVRCRLLALVALGSLVASPLSAIASPNQSRAAVRLKVAGRDVPASLPVYFKAGETYVGMGILKLVGAKGEVDSRAETARITPVFTDRSSEVALAQIAGRPMLPLSDLARVLRGRVLRGKPQEESEEISPRRAEEVVYLLAQITRIQMKDSSLRLETSFPVPYRARNLREGSLAKGYIDCVGAIVAEDVKIAVAPEMEDKTLKIRTGQNEDTARVVAEYPDSLALRHVDALENDERAIVVALAPSLRTIPERDTPQRPNRLDPDRAKPAVASYEPDPEAPKPPKRKTAPAPSRPAPPRGGRNSRNNLSDRNKAPRQDTFASIEGIYLTQEPNEQVRLEFILSSGVSPRIQFVKNKNQMYIDLPNSALNLERPEQKEQQLDFAVLKHMQAYALDQTNPPMTRIALDVTQNLRYRTRWLDNVLRIDLKAPEATTGSLAGKVIVIDPGHGGHSTGATGRDENVVYEKNITLSLSLKLRSALEALGAQVVMTRDTDVFIPLYDRPAIANNMGADLFISIHNDSSPRANSASGTSTYYHMKSAESRVLANAVQKEIIAVSGLPSRGAISDGNLYQNGLAVLRVSNMPAILVEVAYINNDRDRKRLIDLDFQQSVADAIAKGVVNYVTGVTEPLPAVEKEPILDRKKPASPEDKEEETIEPRKKEKPNEPER